MIMENVKERFAILIRPSGRFETVQIGFDGGSQTILDALVEYFDGQIEWARTSDGYAYITREGAFDDGLTRNDAAAWLANITLFGDVLVLPKGDGGRCRVGYWSMSDAYKRKIWMRTQWEQELEWRSNPEKYNLRNKKHAMQA
jgi:hypothetical protein